MARCPAFRPLPTHTQQIQIQGLPRSLARSGFTIGIWERPTGCFGHRPVALVHCKDYESSGQGLLGHCLSSSKRNGQIQAMNSGEAAAAGSDEILKARGPERATSSLGPPEVPIHMGANRPATKDSPVDWTVGPEWGVRPGPRIPRVETSFVFSSSGEQVAGGSRGTVTVRLRFMMARCQQLDSTDVDAVAGASGGAVGNVRGGVDEGVTVEGALKVQLFGGYRSQGNDVFMHRSSHFYAWVSTADSHSQGGVKLEGSHLDKISKYMRRRSMDLCCRFVWCQ